MERIKKALELAREQREALARTQNPAESKTAAERTAARPETVEVPAETPPKPVVDQPPVLTEVVEHSRSRPEPATPPPPRDAPATVVADAHAAQESTVGQPPAVAEKTTSPSDGQREQSRESDAATVAIQPEAKPVKESGKERAAALQSAVPSDIRYSRTRQVDVSAEQMEANRLIAGIKNHPQSDLFRVLRTKILHRMRVDKITSLAITSPTKGAGKSMVSANLAVSLAMEANQTVLLVDLDLRKPAISRYFGIDAQQGVADYLIDNAELPGLLVHPGIERLVLLPAGNPVPQSSELLSTPRMGHLVEDITSRYASRIVLFDLPPLLHLDDALIFLPQVQASLLVVEEGSNSAAEVEQSLMLLEKSNLLGTVYNKARQTKHLPY